jgi:sugar phosphate isomerase/epimerase
VQLTAAGALGSVLAGSARALAPDNAYRRQIGLQLYTLRRQIAEDAAGTLKAVAEAGYRQVEPYGYPNAQAMIAAAKANGLAVHSAHFEWESVTNPEKEGVTPFADILARAREDGLTHLVVPYLHEQERRTLDDYRRLAERCNAAAARAKEAGIQLAYHNHAFEFQPHEGAGYGYRILMREFSADMKFEIDVFWVKVGGVEPVALMNRLPNRVSQLHLKDLKAGMDLPNFGGVPPDAFQALGDGIIPMAPILQTAAAIGVVHAHVEQDESPDPIASIRQSVRHLATL